MTTLEANHWVKPRWTTLLLLLVLLAWCPLVMGQAFAPQSQSPTTESVEEVSIIQEVNSRQLGSGYCGYYSKAVGPVVAEDEFRNLIEGSSGSLASSKRERCEFLNRLKIDFEKHSLLTYGVTGDCFVRGTAQISRSDSLRKYALRITKIYGGCRAGGSFEGWLVVEKLRPDYKIEVELFGRDESGVTRRLD